MPGISRRPAASSVARSCGWLEAMSAALRYARILKGFSSLISSRSAISRRMRAMAALSNPETFHLDLVVEHTRSARGQRRRHRVPGFWRSVADDTSAATGAADFRRGRTRALRARDHVVDRPGRHARRELLPVVPFTIDLAAHFVPVAAEQRP